MATKTGCRRNSSPNGAGSSRARRLPPVLPLLPGRAGLGRGLRRVLKQVKIENTVEADKVFDVLMGSDVSSRKSFIQSNATKANLDV
jgi:hypothetical protein